MAIKKLNKLIKELKLVKYSVRSEKNRRKQGVFAITGFYLEDHIQHILTLLNNETRVMASIRIFKTSLDKDALILLNLDVIIPHLIAIKLKDSEFHFEFKEESYLIGLLIDRSISKQTQKFF